MKRSFFVAQFHTKDPLDFARTQAQIKSRCQKAVHIDTSKTRQIATGVTTDDRDMSGGVSLNFISSSENVSASKQRFHKESLETVLSEMLI